MALGVEAAGVVESVGEGVLALAPGDEVLTHPVPLRDQGAWAERLVAPAAAVAPKPSGVPWAEAAAFPVPALTADQALAEAAPDPDGEWVLVHGAGGVTGGLICNSQSREERPLSRRQGRPARLAFWATARPSCSTT